MARPRVLDETKQREVCALASAGVSWPKVARYVGCCVKTIRRERADDPDFDQRVRRAELAASLTPLEAVRRASATHWRAAAWMIDREDRREGRAAAERRRAKQKKSEQTADQRVGEVLQVVREVIAREVDCPLTRDRIEYKLDQRLPASAAGLSSTSPPPPGRGDKGLDEGPDGGLEDSLAFLRRLYEQRDGKGEECPAGPAAAEPAGLDSAGPHPAGPASAGTGPAGTGPAAPCAGPCLAPDPATDPWPCAPSDAATAGELGPIRMGGIATGEYAPGPGAAEGGLAADRASAADAASATARATASETGRPLPAARLQNGTKPSGGGGPSDGFEPAIQVLKPNHGAPSRSGFVPVYRGDACRDKTPPQGASGSGPLVS